MNTPTVTIIIWQVIASILPETGTGDLFRQFWKCLWTLKSLTCFLPFFFPSFFHFPTRFLSRWNTAQILCCLNTGSHTSNFIKDVKCCFILNPEVLPNAISSSVHSISKCDSIIHGGGGILRYNIYSEWLISLSTDNTPEQIHHLCISWQSFITSNFSGCSVN